MAKSKWTGKKLSNRYVIDEMLGQGGMSAVYKASDPNLKRVVAVKMIHTHLSSNPDFVQRFEEEAAAVAQLRHHGIIQVYDFNQDDDVYYMVLEFVPGETIQDHLKRLNDSGRRLSIANAVTYMADICDAVDYAHQRGMIHRDIKPANLMLNPHGQVILMDFGIAKIVGGQRHTATGAVVGTAMYMSPEQIRGEQPDRRTDIYSLGVTLFEMVGGHPPFQADSAMTLMMMHVNDPVPDPRKLNPEVPDDLVAVINKALAKNPNDRYQTAAQMASALRNISARIKSGSIVDMPGTGGTMIEESPMVKAGSDATAYENLPATPAGTVVESAQRPGVPAGTVVESAPHSTMPSIKRTDVGGTAIESSAVRPAPAPRAPGAGMQPKKSGLSVPMIAGGIVILACLVFGGIFLVSRVLGGGGANPEPTEAPAVLVVNTEAPTATALVEVTATLAEPTEIPTETAIPFTPTPETPYVVITGIRLENNAYVVDYEINNFPSSPQLHVHMFFNTVPPEQAGSPASGPWKLTSGPYGDSPFTQYGPANRPPNATQMCSLVANTNHSIILNSGNCVDLP
jgi:serine/threonine protein kinase